MLRPNKNLFNVCNDGDDYVNEHPEECVHDLPGASLDPKMVRQARQEEIAPFKAHDVYKKVPLKECIGATGKQPIGSMCIDKKTTATRETLSTEAAWTRRR